MRDTLTVRIRPGAFRAPWSKTSRIRLQVDTLDHPINPAKAQRLFYGLLVTNTRLPGRLLVIDQPDFLVLAMMLCQPFAPLIPSSDKQSLTNFHVLLFSALRCRIHLIAPGSHYKIITMQLYNFMRTQEYSYFTPFSQQIRAMSLFF